jgi:6,7-dimethyl-8-ribityllumazine synthase
MTSSDVTALDPGAISAISERVGRSFSGGPASTRARVAVVGGKFNGGITQRLVEGALDAFDAHGIDPASLSVAWVPGAFEIPIAAKRFASSGEVDAVVALGAVIRGETAHFEYVAGECARGCQRVAIATGVPVVFGVLTTEDVDQALARCAADKTNRGYEAAVTALEMVDLLAKFDTGRELGGPRPGAGS